MTTCLAIQGLLGEGEPLLSQPRATFPGPELPIEEQIPPDMMSHDSTPCGEGEADGQRDERSARSPSRVTPRARTLPILDRLDGATVRPRERLGQR